MKSLIAILFISLSTLLLGCKTEPTDYCSDDSLALGVTYVTAKNYVTRSLRSPSTAIFQRRGGKDGAIVTHINGCIFRVTFHVDAQNAFGATVREHFDLQAVYVPTTEKYHFTTYQVGFREQDVAASTPTSVSTCADTNNSIDTDEEYLFTLYGFDCQRVIEAVQSSQLKEREKQLIIIGIMGAQDRPDLLAPLLDRAAKKLGI